MLKIIVIAMLIAVAAGNGLDVAACVRIFRGICTGAPVADLAACTAACGIGHVGVCLAIPQLELGAEVCVCIS